MLLEETAAYVRISEGALQRIAHLAGNPTRLYYSAEENSSPRWADTVMLHHSKLPSKDLKVAVVKTSSRCENLHREVFFQATTPTS